MQIERALIVDDNAENSSFLQQCLVGLKFNPENIRIVADAEDGLRSTLEHKPELVCVSWEITPVPGTVFVQRMRGIRRFVYTPVLIYSRRLTDDDIFLAKELGLEGLLRLPFHKDSTLQTITKLVEAEKNISRTERKIRKIEHALENDRTSEALGLVDSSLTKSGPQFVRAHTVLANLWFQMKKLDRAESMVSIALREDSGYTPALQIFARIRSAQGRHDEAIKILLEMAELAPGNLTTMLNLGASYQEADRTIEAKATLNELSRLDPENQAAKAELGKVAYKEGDHERAKELMSQTGQGNKMATFFNDIAIALVNRGDFDKGIKTYRDAMKILSDSKKLPLLHYNLGLAFRKKGDLMEAFRSFCQSYVENPRYEKAYASLVATAKQLKDAGNTLDPELVKAVKNARCSLSDKDAA